eukprot:TRINITY_DN5566_c0_g1_i6.p1 TRINITY_DN5566_c0_g1~~TRINITY_DN5566_c0_g1_i6.p1  ORF type:complete len:114 (-),score=16.59 TRINITY_DN5566_c0_g1_i6:27-368(-)
MMLDWADMQQRKDVREARPHYDYILASDCAYYHHLSELFVSCLSFFLQSQLSPPICAILAMEEHNQHVYESFLCLLTEKYGHAIKEVPFDLLHPTYRSRKIHVLYVYPSNVSS